MKPFSFIFAGTSEFALDCLKLLISSTSLNLKGVVTRPNALKGRGLKKQNSAVKAWAQKQDLPIWSPQTTNEANFLQKIHQQKCDFSFVCSYGQILPVAYLQSFPKGCLNLHLSLLPKWRGAAPVQRALMAGDTTTGVGLQIMTEKLDCGNIIGQREFDITEDDNAHIIFEKSLIKTKSLISKELVQYLNGKLKGQPQNHTLKTYAHKIDKTETKIIWTKSAINIHNKIRALFLGPQAYCILNGKRIKIYKSKIIREKFKGFSPGEVCSIQKTKLMISCGENSLSLLEVQKEGKKRQKIEDFLNGCAIKLKDAFC